MKNAPVSVWVTLLLIFLNAAFWVIYAVIAVLSITDQVGLPDLLTLVLSLAALVLVVKDRAWYLQENRTVFKSG